MFSSRDAMNLRDQGYFHLGYPRELKKALDTAVEKWKGFCALSEEEKILFPFFQTNGTGVGYELKKTPGAKLDLKEDFHFTRAGSPDLEKVASTIQQKKMNEFVSSASFLMDSMESTVKYAAFMMEGTYVRLNGLRQEVVSSRDASWILRFLHYFEGSKPGEEIAKAHADKSGFTLHLYESDPGLQYLDHDYKWKGVPISSEDIVIFPGMRGQYRSENDLKATCHRVVANKVTAAKGRFSVVCFVHLDQTPAFDKDNAGRLQEFKPGFNYKMPFAEFSKLFVKP